MERGFSNRSDTRLALNILLYNSHCMCFITKEIVVCSCNLLFNFFVRYKLQFCQATLCRPINYDNVIVWMSWCSSIIKVNEYRSMLYSLWITYILFAEKFQAKINTNIYCFKTFIVFMATALTNEISSFLYINKFGSITTSFWRYPLKSVRRKALGWISYFTPSSSSVPPNIFSSIFFMVYLS